MKASNDTFLIIEFAIKLQSEASAQELQELEKRLSARLAPYVYAVSQAQIGYDCLLSDPTFVVLLNIFAAAVSNISAIHGFRLAGGFRNSWPMHRPSAFTGRLNRPCEIKPQQFGCFSSFLQLR